MDRNSCRKAEPVVDKLWDPECLKMETALKAVWVLYRRGKWELLEDIGLSRKRYLERMYKFDVMCIASEHGLLRSKAQVEAFADACPGVRLAALVLIELYKEVFRDEYVALDQ